MSPGRKAREGLTAWPLTRTWPALQARAASVRVLNRRTDQSQRSTRVVAVGSMRTTAFVAAWRLVRMAAGMAMRTVATAAAASTTNAAATAAAATTPAIACTAVAFGSSTSLSIFARFTVFAGLSRALVTARDLVGWPVETLHLLAERLDFALVSSFLALRFFDKFEELVHGFRGVAQDDERRFDFLHCLADAR